MTKHKRNRIDNPSRRRSLQAMLAMSAAGLTPSLALSATESGQRTRKIPSSGESIPVMGLGTARTFDVAPMPAHLKPLREVVRQFVERGGAMIDTSPMYGQAEDVVGRLVTDVNGGGEIFYATKVWTRGEQDGLAQMNASFERMRTDFVHLMQVHNLSDTATQIRNIRKLQDQGRVRYLGITHYTTGAFDDLESWMKKEKLDYIQFPYSIANRVAEERLIPAARDRGVAVIAHRNYDNGRLFGQVKNVELPDWAEDIDCRTWGNFFLKYLMGEPGVTNLIPATSDPKHLQDNMNAGLGRLPDEAMRRRMVAYFESI